MISKTIQEYNSQISYLLNGWLTSRSNQFKQIAGRNLVELTTPTPNNLSISLKDIPYKEMYSAILAHNNYHVLFADGGLIQLNYLFEKSGVLIKHRLAYFPAPVEELPTDINLDEEDIKVAELLNSNRMIVPVRFDFDPNGWSGINHTKTHLTLGAYKNCRIPVSEPLGPKAFIQFILSSFYNIQKHVPGEGFITFPRSVDSSEEKYLKIEIGTTC